MNTNIEKMIEQEEIEMQNNAVEKRTQKKTSRKTMKICKVVYENKHTRVIGFIGENGVGYQMKMPDNYKMGSKIVRVQFGDSVKIL